VNQEDALRTDVHQALDAIATPTPELLPAIAQRLRPASRRRPLSATGQVAAVLGIGLIVGGIVFATHRARVTPATVTTSPTTPIVAGPGANIAWIPSQQSSGGTYTGDIVTGVDASGHVVGRINARDELRSPDGSHLYALADSGLDVYSAVDGHKEQTMRLSPVTFGQPMLSADGHYFAVVGNSPPTLQLVDLAAGRSVASINVGSPAYGAPIIVGAQAQHVYVVGATVAKFAFDGTTLRLEQSATGHTMACDGLVVGGPNSAGGLPFRVLADGRTLVAFCPGDGRVTWFDLVAMKVTHEVQIGQRNPFWVSPVFSADGKMLYLHEGGTGQLHAIDLVQQKIIRSTKVAAADTNPLAWLRSLLVTDADAGGIPRTAAVSPDGTWLYAVGIFGAPGGLALVHLPDLAVKGRWLPTVGLNSVWVSADGQTIYLLGADDQLRVLRTDGSVIAKVALPANASDFIVPTTP
jgi:outer membrane protein assembly factor BamB